MPSSRTSKPVMWGSSSVPGRSVRVVGPVTVKMAPSLVCTSTIEPSGLTTGFWNGNGSSGSDVVSEWTTTPSAALPPGGTRTSS